VNIYVIGSLTNPRIQQVAAELRYESHTVFDSWHCAGPDADRYWQTYEMERGHTFVEALQEPPALHTFDYDKRWLDWADVGVLVMPAGKSGHLELGYLIGQGKMGYILLDEEPAKWDVMYAFADAVAYDMNDLVNHLGEN
jgi:hypothetical protein